MYRILLTTIVAAAIVTMAAACTGTPHLHRHWGKSIETAKQNQTVNPQAGRESAQASDMDGTAADHAIDSYQNSFKGLRTE